MITSISINDNNNKILIGTNDGKIINFEFNNLNNINLIINDEINKIV